MSRMKETVGAAFWRLRQRLRRILRPRRYKQEAELRFWIKLRDRLTRDAKSPEESRKVLLDACHWDGFKRYAVTLSLPEDAFQGKRVLDLGCGPFCGLIGFADCEKFGADHLADEYRRIGYPLDDHGIAYAAACGERLPYPHAYFDVVTCINALDHVDRPGAVIREIARVLKPDGRLMGQVNFHDQPTATEPHKLDWARILRWFDRCDLALCEIRWQLYVEATQEHRYYVEAIKSPSGSDYRPYRVARSNQQVCA